MQEGPVGMRPLAFDISEETAPQLAVRHDAYDAALRECFAGAKHRIAHEAAMHI